MPVRAALLVKSSHFLFAGSVIANVGLLLFISLHSGAPALPETFPPGNPQRGTPMTAGVSSTTADSANLGRDFDTVAVTELKARLAGSGLPPSVVEQLLVTRINRSFQQRRAELLSAALKSAPPWRLAAAFVDRLSVLTPKERDELRLMESAARDEILRTVGPGPLDRDGAIAAKYGFVSPTKAVQLDALDRDYVNFNQSIEEESRYLKLPEDRERRELLKKEQARDVAALLTPEERDGYELSSSPAALDGRFRMVMRALQPSDDEYRALLAVQEKYVTNADPSAPPKRPTMPLRASMLTISGPLQPEDEIKAVLSPERFAQWQLAATDHYQRLISMAAVNGIAPETVKSVAATLSQAAESSWQISDDSALDVEGRKAALVALADRTRTQIGVQLGPNVAAKYLESVRWFNALKQGNGVMVKPGVIAYRPAEPQKAPARP